MAGKELTTIPKRLEYVRERTGNENIKEFWKALMGRIAFDDDYSVSYEALRTYHLGREAPVTYLVHVADAFGYRLEWLATGRGAATIADEEASREKARLAEQTELGSGHSAVKAGMAKIVPFDDLDIVAQGMLFRLYFSIQIKAYEQRARRRDRLEDLIEKIGGEIAKLPPAKRETLRAKGLNIDKDGRLAPRGARGKSDAEAAEKAQRSAGACAERTAASVVAPLKELDVPLEALSSEGLSSFVIMACESLVRAMENFDVVKFEEELLEESTETIWAERIGFGSV